MVDLSSILWPMPMALNLLYAIIIVYIAVKAGLKDFRRCSSRTMGEWARFTRRRWIWREFRFEIKVSTPSISIAPSPAPYMVRKLGLEGKEFKQYTLCNAMATGSADEDFYKPVLHMNSSDRPWFLAQEANPRQKCSWLTLLEDTAKTNVRVTIGAMESTFDSLLDRCDRPLATADRTSFLTLMCLFGIRWEKGGSGKSLVGEEDACEVSAIDHPNHGSIFVYKTLVNRNDSGAHLETLKAESQPLRWSQTAVRANLHQMHYLPSEKARLAMFNCFDLGFATFRTHDETELLESLKQRDALSSEKGGLAIANTVVAFYNGSNGWCPGLSESITCWAEQSMPKMVDEYNGKFKSMYSAVPARSLTTGTPQFVAMLLGDGSTRYEYREEVPSVRNVTNWAREYLQSFPQVHRKVYGCLKWAATWSPDYQNNVVDPDIPWAVSLESLMAISELDEHLDHHLLTGMTHMDKRKLKSAMSNQQIVHGANLFTDAKEAAETHGGSSWLDELDRVGAENYEKIAAHLADLMKELGHRSQTDNSVLAQRIVINRLMRGSLWVVHNGNAPDQYKSVLECSLSSSLLDSNPIVYIT